MKIKLYLVDGHYYLGAIHNETLMLISYIGKAGDCLAHNGLSAVWYSR